MHNQVSGHRHIRGGDALLQQERWIGALQRSHIEYIKDGSEEWTAIYSGRSRPG